MTKPLATVAIVGRPNVGKSTLFNRLVGKKLALVDDMPGVTRDRREGEGKLSDLVFRVIDTAGLEDATDESLEARMRRQTELAVAEADITLFVIDARAGITPADRHFGQLLRRSAGRVLLVANKAEGGAGQAGMFEAFELGLGEPIAISAEHGEGMADLFEALEPHVGRRNLKSKQERAEDKAAGQEEVEDPDDAGPVPVLQMAIVGRPNVGKSTMINQLLGEDRMLTGPEAGITRDSIAVPFQFEGNEIRLVDTAGIRRKARVQTKLEKLSVADTLRAVRYAQVVVLVLDATMPMEKQDLTIAAMVAEEGRGLLIALNKWDSVTNRDETMKLLNDRLSISLTQVKGIPVIPCSGRTGKGLDQLLRAVFKLYGVWNQRQSTSEVNRWLEGATGAHPPPMVSGRRIKIRYATQIKTRPPTFALFVSKPEDLPDSYMQYLRNSLRESFGMDGVPVRLVTRKGKNPYAPD